ncbi:hypothetical protein TNCV_1308951 [Trichonephila clavipes]|nr:hypothetical protein TNCV_1308951 [Trichonephila clavipes]
MYKYRCPCSFDTMPQLINHRDWRMVISQSLGSHRPDVFYWREIWGTCRRGQSKKVRTIPATCGRALFCLNVGFRKARKKGSATGRNTPEMARDGAVRSLKAMPVLWAVSDRGPLRPSTAFRITVLNPSIPYSANSQLNLEGHE